MGRLLKVFLSFICAFMASSFLFSAKQVVNRDFEEDLYNVDYPPYEEPISISKNTLASSRLMWIPSSHAQGLNILGLLPSVQVGVGTVRFGDFKENSTLFEYNWGYTVFSWISLAFTYQNQHMEIKNPTKFSISVGNKNIRNESKFALHSLMFKSYIESPKFLKVNRFFMTPYLAGAIGPGWVQKGIFGASVKAWEFDAGFRFGTIHPMSFISFLTGGKYIRWGTLGDSFCQYIGLRLNF